MGCILGEMIIRKPLFKGVDRILSVCHDTHLSCCQIADVCHAFGFADVSHTIRLLTFFILSDCRHLSHYQIAVICHTVRLQNFFILLDCRHLSHYLIADISHTFRLQTSLRLSDCRHLSYYQIGDISYTIKLQTSLILSDCRHFLHYHIADISHTIRFRLNGMTVGQNKQLLWEQTDFDFTIGQCLA